MAKAKTNTEIIRDSVQHIFSREQIHTLAAAHFSAETIAAHASGIIVLDKDGNELDPTPDAELILVSGLFHTFQEWKKDGMSVKKGEKAAFPASSGAGPTSPTPPPARPPRKQARKSTPIRIFTRPFRTCSSSTRWSGGPRKQPPQNSIPPGITSIWPPAGRSATKTR